MNPIVTKPISEADNKVEVGKGALGLMESQVNQSNNTITLTEGRTLLVRACEAVRQARKKLSEYKRLHINSTVSFDSNCRMHTSSKKLK